MRRPVDQSIVKQYQQQIEQRQQQRLARIEERRQSAMGNEPDRGTFHLKDEDGNVIPHRTDADYMKTRQ
ncbi:MAG: hypothetical protein GY758_10855 [Fuerstiella sp.]|nr:hypothetical protein [Fuerstiella sp.]